MSGGTRKRYEIGVTATINFEQYIYTGTVPCFATDDQIQTGSVAGFRKVVASLSGSGLVDGHVTGANINQIRWAMNANAC